MLQMALPWGLSVREVLRPPFTLSTLLLHRALAACWEKGYAHDGAFKQAEGSVAVEPNQGDKWITAPGMSRGANLPFGVLFS
jgi:hypothetical protein